MRPAEAILGLLAGASCLFAVALGTALVHRRRLCDRLATANRSLLLGAATAAARLEHDDREAAELRAELGRYEGLTAATRELAQGIDRARGDATRAAEGSWRVEAQLLDFTRRIANPQSRGAFGEEALRNQLESLGFRAGRDFERQVKETGGRQRVDYVLRLRELLIAIDPKFALDTEIEGMVEALRSGEEERLAGFAKKLVRHARELARREYWRSLERSPAFVLMYVPVEGALEALRALPDFSPEKFAAEHRVYIVTPLQLGTTLGVIADVAHAARRNEEAGEVVGELVSLDAELARLCELAARESRQLATLVGTHEAIQSALGPRGGVGRIARRVRSFSRRAGEESEVAQLAPPPDGARLAEHYRGGEGGEGSRPADRGEVGS